MASSISVRASRSTIQSYVTRWDVPRRLLSGAQLPALEHSRFQHTTKRASRSFTTSAPCFKKKGKNDSAPPANAAAPKTTPVDALFDLSELESKILKAIERLTHELSLLRGNGKINPDLLLDLKVKVGKGDEKETVLLSDVAHVIPHGRIIDVIVGDEEHIKAVTSAIRASAHSLNPNPPKPDNPLTIPVPIPPPTAESRQQTVEQAKVLGRAANDAVQHARAGHNKKIQNTKARSDDIKKAKEDMEKVVKRSKEDIKRLVDGAVQVLDKH
ncbi:ribosome recycling factor [Pseudovirgaria hyperparasitica]|uniref:Ribosome recycling factor n=1 Tax=Pseudovirgaria hyperparasitica TaxID=470096 RepID=A0A6A6VYE7_9PEZI|nr:ribosome recycling factor [Pseudovirgaria hyperparasitica]KAF2754744.1 ribosome recycling factor [Pseudovirgaria hyperparasitica]